MLQADRVTGTKFETMQTIEETLFANRKTKEKNAPSN
jgi:hypothetical protein